MSNKESETRTAKDMMNDPLLKAMDELFSEEGLKPCPFCESTHIRIFPADMKTGMKWEDTIGMDHVVMCCDCKVSTRKELREIVKNLWNHRSKDNRLAIYQAV